MNRILPTVLGVLTLSLPVYGADVAKSANQRFADANVKETPSLQRHVLPLMGRLGCNGRAWHATM